MLLITHIGPPDERLRVMLTGAYEDAWIRCDGAWKLARRTLRTDELPGAEAKTARL